MRTVIPMILACFLSACNSSDDDSSLVTKSQLPPSEVTAVAALRAEVATLQGQVTRFNELQLIGRPIGQVAVQTDTVRAMRMLGEPTLAPAAVTVLGQFGTCPNMGVQNGFTETSAGTALSALSKSFKTCTGYNVEYLSDGSGAVKPAPRIFWDGPNCTGNKLEWEAGGAGYDTETLQDGVVFINPQDGITELMVSAHQTPQPILIQSVWVSVNPRCQPDVEQQLMYQVTPNVTQTTGVPNSPIGPYTTGAP